MGALATFLFLVVVYSIESALFLFFYYGLLRDGRRSTGVIVSFDRTGIPFRRSPLVPVVRFRTEESLFVEGIPEHSAFVELNRQGRQDEVTVYYQPDNPEKFVIISNAEVQTCWAVIVVSLCGLIRLLLL